MYRAPKCYSPQRPSRSTPSKATWSVLLCEVPPLCRGRRPYHVGREHVGTWEISRPAAGAPRPGPHWEGEEPKPMMHGREKSGLAIVAMKPSNEASMPAGGGGGGAKGGGHGEGGPSTHAPDTALDQRDTGGGPHTAGRNSGLPFSTRGGSRMRESRTYGSVRGAVSNGRPYRDRIGDQAAMGS